ncbi:MAG TPA: alpha/beta fold hydrolase [Anaerolineales bacterium]|nr:alpha/beta fold hydrolase [Anaerolineales bacterium]
MLLFLATLVAGLVVACSPAEAPPATVSATLAPEPTGQAVLSISPAASATPSATWTETLLPSITPTITHTPTPDPYAGWTIEYLANREYGGGELRIEDTLGDSSRFTRYLIAYPSDDLTIYGFMNVPKGEGPFPVIVAIHGYIDPGVYQTLDYTTGYADALARSGYLVLHPNLRGYPPSDDGDNLFRVGMAIDVLNLIELVKGQAGQPGPLELADPQAIGLWGHSMGGGISTRVMTVSPDVDAVVLYGAMSGDEQKNYERIFNFFSNGTRGMQELNSPAEAFTRISPVNFLDRIEAAVSIHHGNQDTEVPLEWSEDLCNRLLELGKSVECYTYNKQPHTFRGEGDQLFVQRTIEFFDRILKDEP